MIIMGKSACWWCCHPFEWESIHWPYEYMNRSNTYNTIGHFCSWSCMKSYAIDKRKLETCEYITLMRKRLEGRIQPTVPAPRKEVLEMFGGTVKIEDFRRRPECISLIMPGEVYQIPIVKVFEDFGEMKLKREKPLERSKGKLENSLGIIRKRAV